MSVLIHGKVLGVADKGEGDRKWAIIGIEVKTRDRDGFDQTELFKVRVFGDRIKEGQHNTYRTCTGTDVYMPVNVEYNKQYQRVEYSLAGLPVRLQQVQPKPELKAS